MEYLAPINFKHTDSYSIHYTTPTQPPLTNITLTETVIRNISISRKVEFSLGKIKTFNVESSLTFKSAWTV